MTPIIYSTPSIAPHPRRRSAAPVLSGVVLAWVTASACAGPKVAVEKPEEEPTLAVRDAALPYHIVDARTGQEVPAAAFFTALAGAEAICVGEQHPNPHDHWAQLEIIDKLTAGGGAGWGLGMEMFQRPFQGVLADFNAGRIDQDALLSRTGWADRWGYDFALYEPMITVAVARAATLLALNTERELLKKVSRGGLNALSDADRARLPEMVLDVVAHRAWFDALMADMGGEAHGHGHRKRGSGHHREDGDGDGDGSGGAAAADDDKGADAVHHDPGAAHGEHAPATGAAHTATPDAITEGQVPAAAPVAKPAKESMADRVYSAQVLWDETMADSAFRWLRQDPTAGSPRQIIILAGGGHCHDTAIVGRLKRRGADKSVSVQPIVDDGEGSVADALATPMNDYLFIMSPRK